MENVEIAAALTEMADLLEIKGDANPFRIRAYRNAVLTVQDHATPLRKLVEQEEDLTELPAIGKDMAEHIRELVETGHLSQLDELAEEIPLSLVELTRLPGVGPKKARKLWDELDITTIDELETAAAAGEVEELDGFGAKTQSKILDAIERHRKRTGRYRLNEVDELVAPLLEYVESSELVERVDVAGSYRRRKETVGDVDLLIMSDDAAGVVDFFLDYDPIRDVIKEGENGASVTLANELQVDMRVLEEATYGAALVYFTGSKEHNIELRQRALERGLSVSEYGVFELAEEGEEGKTSTTGRELGERVAGETEEEVYETLGLIWIPPEMREHRGEIEAAAGGKLPQLITLEDIRGDLQMHSDWSDGKNTMEEMLEACAARSYDYFALTDHSQALAMTGGLDAEKLARQLEEIEELAERHPEIHFLRSMEVDILADGSLDLDDESLEKLDFVVISIHSRFDLPRDEQTKRLIKAIEHPLTDCVGHPTGRIIGRRDPIEFDLAEVLDCAAENEVAMELNAHPNRLDLRDTHLMEAKRRGVPIMISTDAHHIDELGLMQYGVEQARRAWLTAADVLNTKPLKEMMKVLGRE